MARFEPGEDPVAQYYYFDGLGSTVMLTEGLSAVTDRYDYDAWGDEYPIMASTVDNPYRYVGQLGYYTHWMGPSLTDLLHLGIRFYEPSAGRFSQVDPATEGWNWYVYGDGVPTFYVDPTGLYTNRYKKCKGINPCSLATDAHNDPCGDCCLELMLLSPKTILSMAVRLGMPGPTLTVTDKPAECEGECESVCNNKKSGALGQMAYLRCLFPNASEGALGLLYEALMALLENL